jgi:hypothetical protein
VLKFIFRPPNTADPATALVKPGPAPSADDSAQLAWQKVQDTTSITLLEAFIRRYGGSFYADLARAKIEQLNKKATPPTVVTTAKPSPPSSLATTANPPPPRPTAVPQPATPVFPTAVFPKYSGEDAGRARMHTCLDQYNENKATNGNGGLAWIQQGGGYYNECNKRLKG